MKGTFRQSMAWLHTWVGLPVGVVLYFIFLTGTPGYFEAEIGHWMRPEEPVSARLDPLQTIDRGWQRLQTIAPRAESWQMLLPGTRGRTTLGLAYEQPKDAASVEEQLDPATGERIDVRATGGGSFLYRMHYQLHYMPQRLAYWIVEICSLFMLAAIVTGVVVHKKIFKEFFTFRPGKQQRSWLDAHNVLCVVALPFHIVITYSGLLFFADTVMPYVLAPSYRTTSAQQAEDRFSAELNATQTHGLAYRQAGSIEPAGRSAPLVSIDTILAGVAARFPLAEVTNIDVYHPGDAGARVVVSRDEVVPMRGSRAHLVFDGVSGELIGDFSRAEMTPPSALFGALLGVHEGRFAQPVLRWLYFVAGVLGTAMIGTGLVLWTAKRRAQLKHEAPGMGLVLIERLNVATIVGAAIAIGIYFWANRLIPVTLETRAEWEAHALFIAWGAMLVHAVVRPRERAWIEQLYIAATLFGLLPVLNAFTTDRHLGVSLPAGDWTLAGVDITALVFGISFALAAYKVSRSFELGRTRPPARQRKAHALEVAGAETPG